MGFRNFPNIQIYKIYDFVSKCMILYDFDTESYVLLVQNVYTFAHLKC
jgi:hypothetical protein